jgi:hypothetical protein
MKQNVCDLAIGNSPFNIPVQAREEFRKSKGTFCEKQCYSQSIVS